MNTIDTENLRNIWLPAFFAEQATALELNRLTNAACKAGRKNWPLLSRAETYVRIELNKTVGKIVSLGGLLFLGHKTKFEKTKLAAVLA